MLRQLPARPFLVALLPLLWLAPAAQALTISGLSIVKNAGNTADSTSGATALTSTVQTLASGPTSFTTRYAANGAADVGAFASTQGITLNANYTISFSVTHTNGAPYDIAINHNFLGGLTTLDDAAGLGGNGTAADLAMSNIGGSFSGPGVLSLGSLGLATAAGLAGGSSTTGTDLNISQAGFATISAVGSGAPQLFSLTFTFSATARSTCSGLCVSGGDEKAFRFGAPGYADSGAFLANTTADNYPGLGSRVQANDGHFVSVAVIPEPGTLLLLGTGLAGLSLAGRRC